MPTITSNISVSGLGTTLSSSNPQTATAGVVLDETIAAGSTNLAIPNFSLDVSAMSGTTDSVLRIRTIQDATP